MVPVQFELLGQLTVSTAGRPIDPGPGKARLLLVTLLLHSNQTVPHATLLEALWHDDPPASAHANLRTYVRGLRRAFGPDEGDRLGHSPGGYRLRVGPLERDVDRFEAASERGREALATAGPAAARAEFRKALDLVSGPEPLSGLPLTPLLARRVAPITDLWLTVEEEHAETLLALGSAAEAVRRIGPLLERHPLRQRAWAQLMLGQYRVGNVAAALDAYRRARQSLRQESGVDPRPELTALHDDILHHRPHLAGPRGGPQPSPAGAGTPAAATPDAPPDPHTPAPDPTSRLKPRQLPSALQDFQGRDQDVTRLDRWLDQALAPPGTPMIAAVSGMAGVGKTSLALHWAHRVAGRFPDGQLYVDLRGYNTGGVLPPEDALRGFLEALHVPQNRIPPDLKGRAALFRSLLSTRRLLIVLDNCRDAEQVRPLLPGPGSCVAVVTSRDRLTGLVVRNGARPLVLGVLAPREAHALLGSRMGVDRLGTDPDAADAIVRATGGLPLALAIVAARISEQPGFPLKAFADELCGAAGPLDALDEGEARQVFSWSYLALSEQAARLFRLLGLHPGPGLTVAAAAALAGTTVPGVAPKLRELTRLHLLTEQAPGRYAFHDLLRAYAAELAALPEYAKDRAAALHRLFDHYVHVAHPAGVLLQPQWQSFAPVARLAEPTAAPPADPEAAAAWFTAEQDVLPRLVAAAMDSGFEAYAWQLAWALTTFLAPRGLWQRQKEVQQLALAAADRTGDLTGRAVTHRLLARAYTRLGDLVSAEELLTRALAFHRELDDPAGQAQTLHNLMEVCYVQGLLDKAIVYGDEALPLHRRGGNRSGEARTLNAIGWVHATAGDYGPALARCSEALTHQPPGTDDNGRAATLDSIGYALDRLGRHGEAVRRYEEAIGLFRVTADRYHEAETLLRLGDTLLTTENPAAAREAWRAAAVILDELGDATAGDAHDRLARLDHAPADRGN